MIVVTWIARVFIGAIVATWAAIGAVYGAIAVRDWWRRGGKVVKDSQADIDARRHLAAIIPPPPDLAFLGPPENCRWCTDLNSTDNDDCTCAGKCESITWCHGDWNTTYSRRQVQELEEMLREHGHG